MALILAGHVCAGVVTVTRHHAAWAELRVTRHGSCFDEALAVGSPSEIQTWRCRWRWWRWSAVAAFKIAAACIRTQSVATRQTGQVRSCSERDHALALVFHPGAEVFRACHASGQKASALPRALSYVE